MIMKIAQFAKARIFAYKHDDGKYDDDNNGNGKYDDYDDIHDDDDDDDDWTIAHASEDYNQIVRVTD